MYAPSDVRKSCEPRSTHNARHLVQPLALLSMECGSLNDMISAWPDCHMPPPDDDLLRKNACAILRNLVPAGADTQPSGWAEVAADSGPW